MLFEASMFVANSAENLNLVSNYCWLPSLFFIIITQFFFWGGGAGKILAYL